MFMLMTKSKKTAVLASAALLAALLPLLFLSKSISRPITAVLLVLSALLVAWLTRRRIPPSTNRSTVALILTVYALLYLTVYYLVGIKLGFYRNPYATALLTSVSSIVPIAIAIIAMEITRKNVLAQRSTLAAVIFTAAGVVFDVIVSTSTVSVQTFNGFMDLIGLTIIPSLTANILYNYVARRYGAMPVTLYRLILSLYLYAIPYLPSTPDSLRAFILVLLPLIAMWFISTLFEKKRRFATRPTSKIGVFATVLSFILMISIVMLISCKFRFGLIVIATESMTGEINKGDAILYDTNGKDSVEVGDVVVFTRDGAKIVHRVIEIEHVDGVTKYYTQGDANNEPDDGYITSADIVGTTDFKIAYLGYPTLWLQELFNSSARGT